MNLSSAIRSAHNLPPAKVPAKPGQTHHFTAYIYIYIYIPVCPKKQKQKQKRKTKKRAHIYSTNKADEFVKCDFWRP